MPPPRRGGRSRSLAPPELRGALGSLLRTTLAQASAVREALERGAREGRARLDGALSDRRRTEALAELGEVVLALVRRGRHEELADIPELADAIAAVEEAEARGGARRDRDDEPGRDWVVPESRARFDRRDRVDDAELEDDRPARGRGGDGTVSSRAWQPVTPAKPAERVWRPRAAEVPEPEPEPARRVPRPASPTRSGGIVFPTLDDDATATGDDLAEYMHPDDVPPKK